QELNRLGQDDLENLVEEVSIYARVSPEDKLRIVQALQKRGHIVAMTGDGVNDSPALKKADIGVAMGITGTDVAKEAADAVLLDDNFATIVSAVEEGRVIYDNILRFIKYSIAGNLAKVLIMLLSPLIGITIALQPLQLLWLNLLTDGLMGLGLGLEPAEADTMNRPPRDPAGSLFGRGGARHIIWVGLLIMGLSMAVGYAYYSPHDRTWQTMIFTTVAFTQIGNAIGLRAIRKPGVAAWSSNPAMVVVVLSAVTLQAAAVYSPFLNRFFHVKPLAPADLGLCVILGLVVFVVVALEKRLSRAKGTARAG
ncbi:MAG TPA: HAD-IC family P-type ATPase, partial [Deltaproteobacteria bacterium]|nr:HAD-IC family P-type ATPase [Deltaproteobacteria bacterium]